MSSHVIPLAKPRLYEPSLTEVGEFFSRLIMIPDDYLQDIVDGFNRQYRSADKEAKLLLSDYINHRINRNDVYFKTIQDIQDRLLKGKPIILIKK